VGHFRHFKNENVNLSYMMRETNYQKVVSTTTKKALEFTFRPEKLYHVA
jgi:hypothetical protein